VPRILSHLAEADGGGPAAAPPPPPPAPGADLPDDPADPAA
jgi:hypothetical protein